MKLKSTVLIMLGPPGSGKGTQARLLIEKFHLNYFAPGDAVREIVKNETDQFAQVVKERYEKGEPQPDEVITALVKNTLKKSNLAHGIILDPYPLSVGQAHDFMDLKGEFSLPDPLILYIRVGEEEVVERVSKRKFCRACHETHLQTDPTYATNICKQCGGSLYVRPDDTESVVRTRYKKYAARVAEIKAFFDDLNPAWWVDINGEQPIANVHQEIIAKITKDK